GGALRGDRRGAAARGGAVARRAVGAVAGDLPLGGGAGVVRGRRGRLGPVAVGRERVAAGRAPGRPAGRRRAVPGVGDRAAGAVVGEEVVPGPVHAGGVGEVLLVHLLDQPLVGAESRHGGGRGGRPVGARA